MMQMKNERKPYINVQHLLQWHKALLQELKSINLTILLQINTVFKKAVLKTWKEYCFNQNV